MQSTSIVELVCLQDKTQLKVQFYTVNTLVDVIILQFKGTYRIGSSGNDDGKFIAAMTQAAFEVWDPFQI